MTLRLRGSDIRLKHDIQYIGKTPNCIPWYSFRYLAEGSDGQVHYGTMAQELIALGRTDAVIVDPVTGYYRVDYDAIDSFSCNI